MSRGHEFALKIIDPGPLGFRNGFFKKGVAHQVFLQKWVFKENVSPIRYSFRNGFLRKCVTHQVFLKVDTQPTLVET
jgi:hypothetical protein